MNKGIFSSIIALLAIYLVSATFIYMKLPVQETDSVSEIQTIKNQHFTSFIAKDFAERAFTETLYDWVLDNRVPLNWPAPPHCVDTNPIDGICDNYCYGIFDDPTTLENKFAAYFNNAALDFGPCKILNALRDPELKAQVGDTTPPCLSTPCLTDPTNVFVSGSFAYISAAPNGSQGSFSIFNIADPANPRSISQVEWDFDSSSHPFNSPRDTFVLGDYLYIPSYSSSKIIIFDVSDPLNPFFAGEMLTTLQPKKIFVSEDFSANKIYAYFISDTGGSNGAFTIADVTNPANPIVLSELTNNPFNGPLKNLDKPTDIFVSGDYAFITSEPSAYGSPWPRGAILIFDVSDPVNPVLFWEATDNTGLFQNLRGASSVFVEGGFAYVTAIELIGAGDESAMTIIDVSDMPTTTPSFVSAVINNQDGFNIKDARDVFVADSYAYVIAETDNSLTIIDVSDPAEPRNVAEVFNLSGIPQFTMLDGPTSIFVQGDYAYVTSKVSDSLTVIDISNPLDPLIPPKITGPVLADNFGGNYKTTLYVECEAQSVFGDKKTIYRKKFNFNKYVTAYNTSGICWVTVADTFSNNLTEVSDAP